MLLTFLSAAVPLTKTLAYSPRTGEYTVAPYPMVSKMTSQVVEVQDMAGFAQQVLAFGEQGWCLMKGELDRQIVDESRAGRTLTHADHEWVCFDFDKVDCEPTFDGALDAIYKYLPACTHEADAVIQLSASCFHPHAKKLSAHVFMRLGTPVNTKTLHDWLLSLNFTGEAAKEVRLSDSTYALSYPIDVTVSSNAKLLYIAPPRTVGFEPASSEFVRFVPGSQRMFYIPAFTPVGHEQIGAKINELRKEHMLPAREYKTHMLGEQEFLESYEKDGIVIHDVKISATGHIRFNINGGDSLAYYIDPKRPHILGNFKGEPFMYTELAAPKFFELLKKSTTSGTKSPRLTEGTEVLAFYATNRGSAVYIGLYERTTDTLRVERSTTEAAYAWMRELGAPMKSALPHYDLAYDISSNIRYEEGYPVINLYARTEFIKLYGEIERTQPLDETLLERLAKEAPVSSKLLFSVCGSDRDSLKRFLNWLAFIFQKREKPGSAWLFHGTEGTGKGFMLRFLLKPLFGPEHVDQMLMNNVGSAFNSLLEGKLIMNIDEADMSRTHDPSELMAKLRNWITEPRIVINEKHRVEESVRSHVSFIVTSNNLRPIIVPPGDRRWNVAPRQETRIEIFPNEMAVLEQGEELPLLAKLLGELQVDEELLRNPANNEAKRALFEATHGLPDTVALAIREGDTSFFFAARPSDTQLAIAKNVLPISEYDALLRAMLDDSLNVLTTADLYVLFKVAINDDRHFDENTTKQRKLFRRLGLGNSRSLYCRRKKKAVYGVTAPTWQPVTEEFQPLVEKLGVSSNNVVGIGAKR